jgi:hypothetical protein
MSSEPHRSYRFGALERRAVVGPLRAGQVLVAGGAGIAALLSAYGIGGSLGLALALSILLGAAASLLLPVAGRSAQEWAPIAAGWAHRRAGGLNSYRSKAPSAGTRLDHSSELRYALSLPPGLDGLEVLAVPYRQGEVGVLCDRRAGTYTAAMALRGGAFGLREVSEQERALDAWAAVLASTARDGSPIRRLQWIERTLPGDGDQLAGYLQEQRARSAPLDSPTVASYIELIESAAPVASEHEILLCVQVCARRGAREARRQGGGPQGVCRVLLREAEALAERLAIAELQVYGLLDPRAYARVIRDGFDPFGRAARSRLALRDPEQEGTDPALMGPLGAEESWSTYRADSARHSTYWVSAWPRTEVGAAFLAPLLMQSGVVRSVAVTIEPIPFGVAVRKAEAASTSEEADEIQRARQGFSTTARTRRRRDAVARREEEIAQGHAEMRFVGYLTVSGPDDEDLQRSCTEAEHAAQLSRLELQRLYGEQAAGFTFTLPLCRGLR